jgi:hypothetical protein
MDTSTHILVIILSIFLALFLLLSIIIALQIMRLLKAVNRVASKAESIVDSAETVSAMFKDAAGPLAILKVIHNIAEAVQGNKKRRN